MKGKIIAFVLSICLILSVFSGCKAKDKKASSSPSSLKNSSTVAKTSTNSPGASSNATSSAAASAAATSGSPSSTSAPSTKKITDADLGKPFKDAAELFSDNFDNNDYKSDLATLQNPDSIEFANGKMSMSNIARNWGCYSVLELYDVDGSVNKQIEYSVTFNTLGDKLENPNQAPAVHMGLFVGLRVASDAVIATDPGGFWVSFSNQNKVAVYPGSSGAWPNGAVTIDIPVDPTTIRTVTAIDNGNKIYYYITDDSGANILILKAEISTDKIVIYKSDGSVAKEVPNELNTSGIFKLFNHFGNTYVDKITIKGA